MARTNERAAKARDDSEDRLLTEVEVSRRLSVALPTLRAWRQQGGRIPFRRVGTRLVRYSLRDLEKWIAENAPPVLSTTEADSRKRRSSC
jgi:excisionase family DNA binding protein